MTAVPFSCRCPRARDFCLFLLVDFGDQFLHQSLDNGVEGYRLSRATVV
jgi:hypothetical protein